jgi:hypothetical protein
VKEVADASVATPVTKKAVIIKKKN